jgi:small subunit ribosomal protein S20
LTLNSRTCYKGHLFFIPEEASALAIHKSVIKRQKQADKKHLINKAVKSSLKTIAKKVELAAAEKKTDAAKEALVKAMKAYDKAAARGFLAKNTASRKISRLSAKVSKSSAS